VESAIPARMERVVLEVIEVRRKAQALSEELEQVRAERGALLATLEEERAALAAARTALETERARLHERKPLPVPESVVTLPDDTPQPEPIPAAASLPAPAVVVAEPPTPRLPSPRNLLGKLKFGARKSAAEEPKVVEITEATEVVEIAEVAEPVEAPEPELEPEPVKAPKSAPRASQRSRATAAGKAESLPRFASREFLSSLPRLDDDQLDLTAFGIAQLGDDAGIIMLNQQGAELLQVDRNQALDQVLFDTLVPDTGADLCFTEGVTSGKLDVVLATEGGLALHLFRHGKSRTNWVLLRRREQGGEA
jgi:hypothetical protein